VNTTIEAVALDSVVVAYPDTVTGGTADENPEIVLVELGVLVKALSKV
jgi:hypothetical protein